MPTEDEKLFFESDQSIFGQMMKQIPGLIVAMDVESKMICSNNYTAHLFGYPKESIMLGRGPHEMRCPAVECAEYFIKQNQHVLATTSELTILDIHAYSKGQQKILITKKVPFYIDGQLQGTICHCTEIYSTSLGRMIMALAQSDHRYYAKHRHHERSYAVDTLLEKTALSNREVECIFYLIRGYTVKEIAKALTLSPRTVESYLRNIKFKWGCERKSELIDHAVGNGYLGYVPKSALEGSLTQIIHQRQLSITNH